MESEDFRNLSLQNPSKLVLPPLGASGCHQNGVNSSRWIISPMDTRYRCWETWMAVLVAYSVWMFPFEAAFLSACPHKTEQLLSIARSIVDLFFAVDIILTFFVAYIDPTTQLLVSGSGQIAMRYLSTGFIMDVASTLPFEELLALAFTAKHKISLCFSLLGLLRFWRLRRVKHLFTRLEKDIRFSYFWVRSARLLSVTLFLVHCAGCSYYLLADRYPHKGKTWMGVINPNFRETSLWIRYISSVYWSITTFSTVGYGDLHAVNVVEMIFIVFFMLFNLTLTAYLIGNMTDLVVEGTRRTMEFRDSIEAALNFANRNRLPPQLKEQIIAHMCLRFKAECLNQHRLIEQLPKSIYKSISQHLFLPIVEKVYLFSGVSRELLLLLVTRMKVEYFPPREHVILINEAPLDVYIIISGEVELIDYGSYNGGHKEEETVVATLQTGDVFGEVAALCSTRHGITYRTKTLAQLLRLRTHDLIEVMQIKREDKATMIHNILAHIAVSEGHGEYVLTIPKHGFDVHRQEGETGHNATLHNTMANDLAQEHLKAEERRQRSTGDPITQGLSSYQGQFRNVKALQEFDHDLMQHISISE
ncbi:hypothetical protein Nepgr_015950 [Nepenthes gracilis]|uniref:Potassium channel n=1 Tax=Nepenthes gracilis TaxID=150966 RepID=A0AAD3SNV9_NEPGR|nr:hypothetical protein Nepgr_015950 [Nepenthes gracilis]